MINLLIYVDLIVKIKIVIFLYFHKNQIQVKTKIKLPVHKTTSHQLASCPFSLMSLPLLIPHTRLHIYMHHLWCRKLSRLGFHRIPGRIRPLRLQHANRVNCRQRLINYRFWWCLIEGLLPALCG